MGSAPPGPARCSPLPPASVAGPPAPASGRSGSAAAAAGGPEPRPRWSGPSRAGGVASPRGAVTTPCAAAAASSQDGAGDGVARPGARPAPRVCVTPGGWTGAGGADGGRGGEVAELTGLALPFTGARLPGAALGRTERADGGGVRRFGNQLVLVEPDPAAGKRALTSEPGLRAPPRPLSASAPAPGGSAPCLCPAAGVPARGAGSLPSPTCQGLGMAPLQNALPC